MVLKGLSGALVVLALSLPVALASTPARTAPGQRVDLKVLLLSADGTEPGYGAWKAALEREGVPYDTFVAYDGQTRAATLTDARLADYGAGHARYQATIVATGDLGHAVMNADGTTSYLSALSDAEWATLQKFERSFGLRRLSDFTAATAGARPRTRSRRGPGRARRAAHARGASGFPVPQGPGGDRRRRPRER